MAETDPKRAKQGAGSDQKVIIVTGGTGLVGKGIEAALAKGEARDNERWVFLSSKDGDLR
jgi:GDP-L-fucose synthase